MCSGRPPEPTLYVSHALPPPGRMPDNLNTAKEAAHKAADAMGRVPEQLAGARPLPRGGFSALGTNPKALAAWGALLGASYLAYSVYTTRHATVRGQRRSGWRGAPRAKAGPATAVCSQPATLAAAPPRPPPAPPQQPLESSLRPGAVAPYRGMVREMERGSATPALQARDRQTDPEAAAYGSPFAAMARPEARVAAVRGHAAGSAGGQQRRG